MPKKNPPKKQEIDYKKATKDIAKELKALMDKEASLSPGLSKALDITKNIFFGLIGFFMASCVVFSITKHSFFLFLLVISFIALFAATHFLIGLCIAEYLR